jgi:hypothetical protein
VDDEYKRCGTANIFLCVAPLKGKTVVEATEHRAKVDFAHFIRDLCDGQYRDAEKRVVLMDNLNTHSIASLYETFPPAEALRLPEKLESHHTPKKAKSSLSRTAFFHDRRGDFAVGEAPREAVSRTAILSAKTAR